MPHELAKADRVLFVFEEGSISSPKGNVFDPETCPSEEPKMDISFPPIAEDLIQLELRPASNTKLTWKFFINGALKIELSPDATRQHVSLQLLWNEDRPERLRINLSKKSLREIVSRTDGEEPFLEYVPLGTRCEIAVGSDNPVQRTAGRLRSPPAADLRR
jgi:hypothetical protein